MRIASILTSILLLCFLASCKKHESVFTQRFNSEGLLQQEFQIAVDRDTEIITQAGIIIHVGQNAIKSSTRTITLQVKEAFGIEEMIRNGLFTMAGDEALSSDGMFFISTKEKSEIISPISIEIPKNSPDNVPMKLWRGEMNRSQVNWKDPQEIKNIKKNDTIEEGKVIFNSKCAACHRVDKFLVAPPLAGLANIRTQSWLYAFTRNNSELRNSGDQLACCIWNEWNKLEMPSFNLSDHELKALYLFVDEEMRKKGFPPDYKPISTCDSCAYYTERLQSLTSRRKNLVSANGNTVKIDRDATPNSNPLLSNGSIGITSKDTLVRPKRIAAEYYQLSVKAYGWYNLDILLKSRSDTSPSFLAVRIQVPVEIDVSVMLVIPEMKVFLEGGLLDNKTEYGFAYHSGKIFLPQNAPAYIIAYGETGGKNYFAMQKFITTTSQTISVDVPEKDSLSIYKIISTLNLQGLELELKKTVNSDSIISTDKEMKFAESRLKNCSCYVTESVADSSSGIR